MKFLLEIITIDNNFFIRNRCHKIKQNFLNPNTSKYKAVSANMLE